MFRILLNYRQDYVWGECLSGKVLIAFSDYGGKEGWGPWPRGMKSTVPPSQIRSQTGPRLPLQMLTGSPTFSLGACCWVLSHTIPDSLCPIRGMARNKTFSCPWGLLGTAGSLEQLPAAAGDRKPRNVCASLAFLGRNCPATVVTGLYQAPLWASLLVHFIPL